MDNAHSKRLCYICGLKVKYMKVHMEKRHKVSFKTCPYLNIDTLVHQLDHAPNVGVLLIYSLAAANYRGQPASRMPDAAEFWTV